MTVEEGVMYVTIATAVISAMATVVSTVIAVLLGKIVVADHQKESRRAIPITRSPVVGGGVPITPISIENFHVVVHALSQIADACGGKNGH